MCVPSVPAAAPARPLVALDALHPVANDTSRPAAGVFLGVAPFLPGITPVLNDTLPPTADVLPGVERSVP